jgi:hypothetical protein
MSPAEAQSQDCPSPSFRCQLPVIGCLVFLTSQLQIGVATLPPCAWLICLNGPQNSGKLCLQDITRIQRKRCIGHATLLESLRLQLGKIWDSEKDYNSD